MQNKYPDFEKEKYNKLNSILKDWKKTISKAEPIKWKDDNKYYPTKKWFSEDGFFPYYFNQKPKILFIAREDRNNWNTVNEWMDIFHGKHKRIIVTRVPLFRPLLRILYGINNDFPKYNDIPKIREIAQRIGKSDGFSFAIMELSKYGNKNYNSASCNTKLITRFLEDSKLCKRNYYKEELELLDPDIIIVMELHELSDKITEYLDKYIIKNFTSSRIKTFSNGNIALHSFKVNKKKIPVIDMYHFSSRGKKIEEYYYNPIVTLLKSKTFKDKFPNIYKKMI
jgi:hypothetical protein